MEQVETQFTQNPLSFGPVAKRFLRYLLTLTMPLTSLAFVLTGPHTWYWALAFWLVLPVHKILDVRAKPGRVQPIEGEPAWLYTGLLCGLAVLHLVIVVLACRMMGMAELSVSAFVDLMVARMLIGTSAGLSGIVVAHELMHRPSRALQFVSRLVMGSVLYEHFFTEHIRGHHVRVGLPEDPATARFNETFRNFFRRTVPGQFKSAWAIEIERNGLKNTPAWHPRNLNNRVVQGIAGELLFIGTIGWQFGVGGLLMLVLVAAWAIRLLEAVNYFEHWGITRVHRKVMPVDSWDTESSFTLFGMVGLSRHADHHAYASKPYQKLRHFDESPKYPGGYITMATMVMMRNAEFIALATKELEARKLGPFREQEAA